MLSDEMQHAAQPPLAHKSKQRLDGCVSRSTCIDGMQAKTRLDSPPSAPALCTAISTSSTEEGLQKCKLRT